LEPHSWATLNAPRRHHKTSRRGSFKDRFPDQSLQFRLVPPLAPTSQQFYAAITTDFAQQIVVWEALPAQQYLESGDCFCFPKREGSLLCDP
jgi:hypothetical protein